ncbi:MAG TPA: helix-hairpin-helix domain-containing protein, partial [Pyrinomonadaceae bacterium]|nr:helix-hairpin-helix domain-containing protein [Pyrinomonadaceae bacterium]
AIDARRSPPLDRFLNALGIRHVGEVTARDLARRYASWAAFRETIDHALARRAELSPAVGETEDKFLAREAKELAAIIETPGVGGVHDLHVWTISSGIHALSAHITHDESIAHSELLVEVRTRLHERFGIDHLTIQMETPGRETEAVYICETGTKCFEPAIRSGAH